LTDISIARPRRRPRALGVDVLASLSLVGTLTKYLSLAYLLPIAVAVIYSESVRPWVLSIAIAAGVGFALERLTGTNARVGIREGFLVVSLTWLAAAALGALPYLLSGEEELSRPVDAYFEAMSGFTTTGASVLTDVEGLSQSLAMWRQFTQWLGGMGIIVLFLAVLPRLRVGGRQMFESELPGPELEALTVRIRDAARQLWVLYVGLTAAEVLALALLGWTGVDERMNLFEAVAHAFTTLPTGGFSTQARSIEQFAAATQWVLVLFMALAGANFALHYRALVRRRPGVFLRDEEFRLYVGLLTLGSLVLFLELLANDLYAGEEAVRAAAFQAVSMMTTTGFATADVNEWGLLAAVVLVALMFIGGSAGSTAGSVKVVRHLLLGRILRRELDVTVHPELVTRVRLNGRPVDGKSLRAIESFVLLYIGVFAVGTLLLVLDAARVGLELRLLDAVGTAATTLGNVGPAFGFAGPMGSFEPYSDVSTLVAISLMWAGRLEIIPIVVLLTRSYWRN
jgi:trk system potassium uptake protein TrkH